MTEDPKLSSCRQPPNNAASSAVGARNARARIVPSCLLADPLSSGQFHVEFSA